MVKWVVCDIDGTLLKHQGMSLIANELTINKINELKKNDEIIFTFATGRHYLNTLDVLKEKQVVLSDNDFVIGLNGSQIYSLKKQALIFEKYLDTKIVHNLDLFISQELKKSYPDKYLVIFYGKNDELIILKDEHTNFKSLVDDVIRFHGSSNKDISIKMVDNLSEITTVFKCTFYIKDKDFDYEHLKKALFKITNNQASITRSTSYLLELMPPNINKATALEYINQNYYNFNKDQILAFGDSLNDLEMFKFASTSITRINGDKDLKEVATYVLDAEPSDFVLDGLELLVG